MGPRGRGDRGPFGASKNIAAPFSNRGCLGIIKHNTTRPWNPDMARKPHFVTPELLVHKEKLKRYQREYNRWCSLKDRCYNPKNKNFHNYGGRGITLHADWHDFDRWLADVGYPPGPNYSIDRIDVNRGYEPENVRWATPATQANNKRPSRGGRQPGAVNRKPRADARHLITHDGKPVTTAWVAASMGIPRKNLEKRLQRIRTGRQVDRLEITMDELVGLAEAGRWSTPSHHKKV